MAPSPGLPEASTTTATNIATSRPRHNRPVTAAPGSHEKTSDDRSQEGSRSRMIYGSSLLLLGSWGRGHLLQHSASGPGRLLLRGRKAGRAEAA